MEDEVNYIWFYLFVCFGVGRGSQWQILSLNNQLTIKAYEVKGSSLKKKKKRKETLLKIVFMK